MDLQARFGAFLSMHPPEQQFALARRCEALGLDSLWTGDHVSFHNPIYESLTLLASYASITSRIKLGSGVYLLALRRPTVVAKITSTLDALCGGRLIFGVGVGGENPKEFEACGVPHKERGARVTERPGPPIWIGGRSDAALARAGRQGDGWISYVVQPERYAQSLDKIRRAADAAGRSLDGFVAGHLTFVTVGRDYESAERAWVRILSNRYAQDFGPLARKYGVIGTPEQCAEQIDRFMQAGCRYFVMNPIGDLTDEPAQLETIASEIIPRFQKR